MNYFIDESKTIGPNGTKSHGPNSVISMLDHYFSTHSLKESVCHCHGPNSVISMLDHYFSTHSLKESVCHCHADNPE